MILPETTVWPVVVWYIARRSVSNADTRGKASSMQIHPSDSVALATVLVLLNTDIAKPIFTLTKKKFCHGSRSRRACHSTSYYVVPVWFTVELAVTRTREHRKLCVYIRGKQRRDPRIIPVASVSLFFE